ncbi:BZ3500_MvSof-1268-A1-R1_Chr1-3g02378 [Microbotryum saponariae]|uniref:BZ3500_MvSof-1268-A1-R1_Chr1-3g02378 protein n=1 Tax=Microbotryum saponariae TaxID=289078 RepID=A0A2X0KWD8_9BASI|nr:BZ3500_MvSof-1268-A1-R1_Chr1-3g02378 [Microbotryum saponariae]SCZ96156.1 BZ3501_MvSof-1269-A2-R1_Chr1-3g01981 [Microbotryum saponariae]
MLNYTDLPWNGERTSEDVISRRVRSPQSPVQAVFTTRTKRRRDLLGARHTLIHC